jgi:hypothetical protein
MNPDTGITKDMIMAEMARRELAKRGVSPDTPKQQDAIEPVSSVEAVFKVPGAAIRSAIQGTGYAQGAMNPSQVPTFQNQALDAYYQSNALNDSPNLKKYLGNSVSATGMAADMVTNPAEAIMMAAPELKGVKNIANLIAESKAGQAIGKVANYPIEKVLGAIPKSMAESTMSVLSGNVKASKNFIKNPNKYNLNPLSEVPESARELERGKQRIDILVEDLRTSAEDSRVDTMNRINDLSDGFKETRQALASGNDQVIKNLSEKTSKALSSIEESSNKELLSSYDNSIKLMNEAKKVSGNMVESSLKDIMASEKTTLPYRNVYEPFEQTLNEFTSSAKLPFKVKVEASGPVITGKTAITDPDDVTIFNNLFQEMRSRNQSGFEISDLQTLKGQLQELSTHYFESKKGNLGTFYQELSKKLNPVNVITSNKELSAKLPNLAKANASYHDILPKFEDANSFFTRKMPSGERVPDFSRAIKAVENNDVSTLRQIEKAESILPEEARLLPKVKATVQSIDQSRKIALAEMEETSKLLDKKLFDTRIEQAKILRSERGSARQEKLDLAREHRNQITKEKRGLDSQISFLKEQEALRSNRIVGVIPGSSIVGETYKVGANISNAVVSPVNKAVSSLTELLKNNPRAINVSMANMAGGNKDGQ